MSKPSRHFAAVAAGLMLLAAASAHAQMANIIVGDGTGNPGDSVTFNVSLNSGGLAVVGTQNDIAFDPKTPIVAKANGRPDCTANPAIMREASQFAFQPPNCTGTACTGIRAIILSFQSVDPIPDGSMLYTCNVAIAADATAGNKPLTSTGASSSDANGNPLSTTTTSGNIVVMGTQPTTPVTIVLGSVRGNVGDTVNFGATMNTDGTAQPVGTQNDIAFDSHTPINAKSNGRPDCTANPDLMREASQFAFQPPNCTGAACTGIRAIILSFQSIEPIPPGSVLYTCNATINEGAAAHNPLVCSGASSSDASGNPITTSCTNGSIDTGGPVSPTSTATQGGTPPVTATATISGGPTRTSTSIPSVGTATATRSGGATATSTVKPTNTVAPITPHVTPSPRVLEDDGCAVVSPTDASAGWLLLLPAAMLLWVRRRTR